MNVKPDDIAAVADAAVENVDPNNLKVLGTKKDGYAGDFVLQNQKTAVEEGFSHVSRPWFEKCMSYDKGMEILTEQQLHILDIRGPLKDWTPVVAPNGKMALRHNPTGRDYTPTDNALVGLLSVVPKDKGPTYLKKLMEDNAFHPTDNEKVIFERDIRDADLLRHVVDHYAFQPDRVDVTKERLFRTWDDGTLRAVLSRDYTIVNNVWFLEQVREMIPGGMLSHWRGDADTIYGNVLIPDTIRFEDDSDYGGMLSIGNSEIGLRRITSVPSVFRAICMNGCIWDCEMGEGISQVHRKKNGQIDLDKLRWDMGVVLTKQIPLLNQGITDMLARKGFKFGNANAVQVMAEICKLLKITKAQALGILNSYNVEQQILGDNVKSAFGLLAAITRYGQSQDNQVWINMDMAGGEIMQMEETRWNNLVDRASKLGDKELERVFGDAVSLSA